VTSASAATPSASTAAPSASVAASAFVELSRDEMSRLCGVVGRTDERTDVMCCRVGVSFDVDY
jgi:hypothetical protein